MNNMKIGFIGAGNMGKAIINGLINSNFISGENILAAEISEQIAERISSELKITVFTDNKELVKKSDIIVLCVKPHFIQSVIENIKGCLTENKLIISIAAGISTGFIEKIIDNKIPVIRVMPNTPALLGEGMAAICRGQHVSDEQMKFTLELFSKIGRSIEIQEKLINAVTGISGSGPAFIYTIIEALADGGVKLGLPKNVAIELAAQTTLGAAKMILETNKHPSVLKDEVTTPGGTTIAGLMIMEEYKVRSALSKTVQETARVADELGK
ncbi:MAG: pyrroline-5-carboxylate reductase [Candidatus Gastranaerophilales bacterium]|nr:pyrroline-5-carboxylate reductase [Candidatus Gastranaerophilales bacterium]